MTQYGKIIVHHLGTHHMIDARGVEVMREKPRELLGAFMIRAYTYANEVGIPLEQATLPSSFPYPHEQDGWILFDRVTYVKDFWWKRRVEEVDTILYGSPHRPEYHASIRFCQHMVKWEFKAIGEVVTPVADEQEAQERLFSHIRFKRLTSLL